MTSSNDIEHDKWKEKKIYQIRTYEKKIEVRQFLQRQAQVKRKQNNKCRFFNLVLVARVGK